MQLSQSFTAAALHFGSRCCSCMANKLVSRVVTYVLAASAITVTAWMANTYVNLTARKSSCS
jgi:hypothetical protein